MQYPSMRRKLIREIVDAKVRFIAIALIVVIGVGIYITTSLSYRNLENSYEYTYEKLDFADFRVKAQRITPGLFEEAESVMGVKKATPRLKGDVSFVLGDDEEDETNLVGRLTGISEPGKIVDDLLIREGRPFNEDETMVCLAEKHFADFHRIKPGDVIYFEKRGVKYPIEIVGIASSPEYIVLAGEKGDYSPMISVSTMALLWMPIEDARWMMGKPAVYNEILFDVDEAADMDSVIDDVKKVLAPASVRDVITREDHMGNEMLKADLESFQAFALFFPMLFLGIACFSIYIMLSRLVYKQRPFIGVMRAIGYTKKRIMAHYLSFALIIAFIGAILGALFGYGLSWYITGVYASSMGIPLYTVKVYWPVIFQGMFMSFLFCMIAGLIPSYSTARLKPSLAMRGESMKQSFRMPLIERVLPAVSKVPLFLKVPIRNIFRTRRRTVFTVIGLVFSIMVVFIFLGVLDTIDYTMYKGFNINNKFDMVAIFFEGTDVSTVGRIRKIPGVKAAEMTVAADCAVEWDGDTVETMLMGLQPDTSMKEFDPFEGVETRIAERRVLLNRWFQREGHLEKGDMVTVSTEYNRKNFLVGGFIDEVMGNVVYLDRDEAKELVSSGDLSSSAYYVKVNPGSEKEVRRKLGDLPGLATVIDLEQLKAEISHYMDFMYIIVYVMLAFGLLMAFALTFNTITINILEREREIATMRTIGTDPWKISAMTSLENLIFGLLAIVPGIYFGTVVAKYAISLQQQEYFSLNFVAYWPTYVIVSVGILVVLLLCQIPSLRHVQSVELAKATKERGG